MSINPPVLFSALTVPFNRLAIGAIVENNEGIRYMMKALAIFIPSLLVFFKNFLEAKYIYAGASLIVAILSMASMATILVLTIV